MSLKIWTDFIGKERRCNTDHTIGTTSPPGFSATTAIWRILRLFFHSCTHKTSVLLYTRPIFLLTSVGCHFLSVVYGANEAHSADRRRLTDK
jgi:hypothetical protein